MCHPLFFFLLFYQEVIYFLLWWMFYLICFTLVFLLLTSLWQSIKCLDCDSAFKSPHYSWPLHLFLFFFVFTSSINRVEFPPCHHVVALWIKNAVFILWSTLRGQLQKSPNMKRSLVYYLLFILCYCYFFRPFWVDVIYLKRNAV